MRDELSRKGLKNIASKSGEVIQLIYTLRMNATTTWWIKLAYSPYSTPLWNQPGLVCIISHNSWSRIREHARL